MKRRSQADVSEETDDSDSEWSDDDSDSESSDNESGATAKEPYPDDKPFPRPSMPLFSVYYAIKEIKMIMSKQDASTVSPKLHGVTNLYEWRRAWEEHVNSLAYSNDLVIQHYHRGLTDCENHKASVLDRYKSANAKKLKKLRREIERLLCTHLQETIELRDSANIVGDLENVPYHEKLARIMSLEDAEPHKLRAAEACSYRKRKINLAGNRLASREHDSVYESDWVVQVVAGSVDVTSFHINSVAEVFEKVEEENLRERYRQLALDGVLISRAQLVVENRVRDICITTLKTPKKLGLRRTNHKRFKSNRREPQVPIEIA